MAYTDPEIDLAAPAGVLPAGGSLLDVVDASAYFANTFNAATWAAIAPADQTIALAEATRWLETLCWKGEKCDPAQPTAWPRKIEGTGCCASAVCTTLPTAVIQAVAELALALNQNKTAMIGGVSSVAPGTFVKRQKLGDLEVEFDQFASGTAGAQGKGAKGPLVLRTFPWLKDLLGCYAELGGSQLAYRVRS